MAINVPIKFALSISETHFEVFVGLWLSLMGALGNGRRGGRSPPLLVAALIACVLLLGFNYWVSNSRNVELQVWHSVFRCSLWQVVKWVAVNYNFVVVLQSRMLEMESHMRQLAADREREQESKLKAEEETRRRSKQLELMQETHQRQQENALINWKHERVWKHSSYTHSQQFRWKLRATDCVVII